MAAKKAATKPAAETSTKKTTESSRGMALLTAIVGKLTGPDSPIGEARPLDATGLRAAEDAAGVALSPSMHALLSHDFGWIAREYGWFDDRGRLLARPTIEIIAEHAGPLAEAYEDLCRERFPGKALALDQGSDSMRLVYFGDPDEHGEYPVLFIDHDDVPMLGVETAGFDLWLADVVGVKLPPGAAREAGETSKRILGSKNPWSMESTTRLPKAVPGPKPGSVTHVAIAPPPAAKERKLTDKQLEKALSERAEAGNAVRLATLVADAKTRNLPKKVFDDALVAAARGGHVSTMRVLLDGGANPSAREYYGAAISRLIAYGRSVAAARFLLDAGADPNGPSVNGTTVLFEAIEKDSAEMVRLLLERGADPNHGDQNDSRPLVHAAREVSDPSIIDALIDHGATVNAKTKQSPALHEAIARGAHDVARRLLARGADANARAPYLKTTALHVAFERGDDAFAGELVRAGSDRSIADERGLSFTEVYGPTGEDARAFELHYAPSSEEQTLTISARIAVMNAAILGHLYHPPLQADHWANLIEHGLAAGNMFDPSKSRARVRTAFDLKTVKKSGLHTAKLELAMSGVAPEFLRLLARRLLGSAMAFTGAGAGAAVRTVGLSIRGGRDGGPSLDGSAFRAWLADDSIQLGAFPGELPFAFRVERGAPALLIVPDGKYTSETGEKLQEAANAWLSMADMWPHAPGPGSFVMLSPDYKARDVARFIVMSPAAPKGARDLFPFAHEPAEAALRNAMRALHATTRLKEVVLTLP